MNKEHFLGCLMYAFAPSTLFCLLVGQMAGESRLSIIYASFVKHFSIDLSLFGFQLFFTNFDAKMAKHSVNNRIGKNKKIVVS